MLSKVKAWLFWRCTAAHHFCCSVMPAKGNKDIMQAPVSWYIPRFIAGLRLGSRYVKRVKRSLNCDADHRLKP